MCFRMSCNKPPQCYLLYMGVSRFNVAVQFLAISLVVGKEAIGHIQSREGPEEAGLLLGIAFTSVIVLSVLCGLKLDLSVCPPQLHHCYLRPVFLLSSVSHVSHLRLVVHCSVDMGERIAKLHHRPSQTCVDSVSHMDGEMEIEHRRGSCVRRA